MKLLFVLRMLKQPICVIPLATDLFIKCLSDTFL